MKVNMLQWCGLLVVIAASCFNPELIKSNDDADSSYSANFWKERKDSWFFPVAGDVLDIESGNRHFGAPRNGGDRAHAGVDLVPLKGSGTTVVAMTDGTVLAYYEFFAGTYALEVKNTDGTIARYCEITSTLQAGNTVKKGQRIGTIIKNTNDGAYMLHLEVYMNTATGPLTDRSNTAYKYVPAKNYQRRSDLLDPSGVMCLKRQ